MSDIEVSRPRLAECSWRPLALLSWDKILSRGSVKDLVTLFFSISSLNRVALDGNSLPIISSAICDVCRTKALPGPSNSLQQERGGKNLDLDLSGWRADELTAVN